MKRCFECDVQPTARELESNECDLCGKPLSERSPKRVRPSKGKRACPHCGRASFSRDEVMSLGPLRSVSCSSCGKAVSVSSGGVLLFLLVFLGPVLLVGGALLMWGQDLFREHRAIKYVPFAVAALIFPLATKVYGAGARLVKR